MESYKLTTKGDIQWLEDTMGLEELSPEELKLLELVKEYHQEYYEMGCDCHIVDEEIERLTEIRNILAKPHEDKLTEIENRIRVPMFERKASFISSFGTVTYRKGAVRRSWNLDALDQICTAKPEIKNEIWPFRKETAGEPTISIKIEV